MRAVFFLIIFLALLAPFKACRCFADFYGRKTHVCQNFEVANRGQKTKRKDNARIVKGAILAMEQLLETAFNPLQKRYL